ncbi:pyruvate, water dikinase regulatory protein [Nesterenkonia natronophila]|uniref:Pyruvate, phosphate dikinase/phosphoenolpyruvate synthase regulator n=1 Tax=Nesterenkonia natronophila TaxID=2174932 RepID=A0A3A4F468_9MICC|nr:pyruvate, phosphate dikinase/phosphoenolpyruvate synthase regulator [Nesterenkonia natronophila]RJN32863.1 pyruvate, phosphate dikinase/phosphoenolpyruvate synthase regulator [Nesterenkonia natronophila]
MVTPAVPNVSVFFVSDHTGITAETLGAALLGHFTGVIFDRRTFSFVNTPAIAQAVLREALATGSRTVLLTTVSAPDVAAELTTGECAVVDLLAGHLSQLERSIGVKRNLAPANPHGVGDPGRYHSRMQAVEYTMEHDDAQSVRMLDLADLVILAPSRCGKTPTALYLALHHGLRVANYPLTEDDYPELELPKAVAPHAARCFGLTSTPQRLSQVRQERRPGSVYASLPQCRQELRWAENLYLRHRIPSLNSEAMSVEEIAAIILQTMNLRCSTPMRTQ